MTWTPSSAAVLSFEPAPGPATTRSVFFETEPATLAPGDLGLGLGLVAGHPLERASKDHGLAGQSGVGAWGCSAVQDGELLAQGLDDAAVVGLGK